jgi:hypothetical protein
MRKYDPNVGTMPRVEYGICLVGGLQQFPETAPYAGPFEGLNDQLLAQHEKRVALRKPVLKARTSLRLVEYRVDRTIRAAWNAAKTADGGRRAAGPITSALFPEGLSPVINPKGRKQHQPTVDLIDRLALAKVPGIDEFRDEWMPFLGAALKDLEAAIAECEATAVAYGKAFKAEKALREQHYNEVDRVMGLVRAAFPRDRETQDVIFPPVDTAGRMAEEDQGDEPSDPANDTHA